MFFGAFPANHTEGVCPAIDGSGESFGSLHDIIAAMFAPDAGRQ